MMQLLKKGLRIPKPISIIPQSSSLSPSRASPGAALVHASAWEVCCQLVGGTWCVGTRKPLAPADRCSDQRSNQFSSWLRLAVPTLLPPAAKGGFCIYTSISYFICLSIFLNLLLAPVLGSNLLQEMWPIATKRA